MDTLTAMNSDWSNIHMSSAEAAVLNRARIAAGASPVPASADTLPERTVEIQPFGGDTVIAQGLGNYLAKKAAAIDKAVLRANTKVQKSESAS